MITNRDNWEEGNPASWVTSPQYQVGSLLQYGCSHKIKISLVLCLYIKIAVFFQLGSPPSIAYEAPTPGSGWANTPGSDAGTPRDSSSAYGSFIIMLYLICFGNLCLFLV